MLHVWHVHCLSLIAKPSLCNMSHVLHLQCCGFILKLSFSTVSLHSLQAHQGVIYAVACKEMGSAQALQLGISAGEVKVIDVCFLLLIASSHSHLHTRVIFICCIVVRQVVTHKGITFYMIPQLNISDKNLKETTDEAEREKQITNSTFNQIAEVVSLCEETATTYACKNVFSFFAHFGVLSINMHHVCSVRAESMAWSTLEAELDVALLSTASGSGGPQTLGSLTLMGHPPQQQQRTEEACMPHQTHVAVSQRQSTFGCGFLL